MNYIILIIVGGLGIWLGFYLALRQSSGQTQQSHGESLITEQSKKKADNLEKVFEFFETKEKVTNNDIEQLLGVSNATAERYLNQLEKEGKITQNGKTGKGVFYTLPNDKQD